MVNASVANAFPTDPKEIKATFDCLDDEFRQLKEANEERACCKYTLDDRLHLVVQCPAGRYPQLQLNGSMCVECPPDTYKDQAGSQNCTECPPNTVTGMRTGIQTINDCYRNSRQKSEDVVVQ